MRPCFSPLAGPRPCKPAAPDCDALPGRSIRARVALGRRGRGRALVAPLLLLLGLLLCSRHGLHPSRTRELPDAEGDYFSHPRPRIYNGCPTGSAPGTDSALKLASRPSQLSAHPMSPHVAAARYRRPHHPSSPTLTYCNPDNFLSSSKVIAGHHTVVLLYMLVPLSYPPIRWGMAACLVVELCTLFLLLKRTFPHMIWEVRCQYH